MDNSSEIKNVDYFLSIEDAILNNRTEEASSLIQKGDLDGETLTSLLRSAINRNNHTLIKTIIDHGQLNSPSIYVQNVFNTAVAKRDLPVIEFMVSHCQFSKLLDKHIPHDAVLSSNPQSKEFVELLLKWNFIINPVSHYDENFVFAAVEKGYAPIVSQLLNFKIDPEKVNWRTGLNLLTTACLNKHHETVDILLKHNASVNVLISCSHPAVTNHFNLVNNIQSFNNLFPLGHMMQLADLTCLHIAALGCDPKMMKIFLQYSANIIAIFTVLQISCIATLNNCEDIVRLFFEHGFNVAGIVCEGLTLLNFCINLKIIDHGHNVVKLLLQHANTLLLIQTPNNTFVFEAIKNGHREIVKTLLKHDACVKVILPVNHSLVMNDLHLSKCIQLFNALFLLDNKIRLHNITCLHVAAFHVDPELVKILLYYNDRIIDDITVLQITCIAVQYGCEEIIRLFLDYGFNVAGITYKKTNLLSFCVNYYKNDEGYNIVELLLQQEKATNQVRNAGNTFIFEAMANGHRRIVQLLLKHNACVKVMIPIDHWTVQNNSRLYNDIHSFNNLFPLDHDMHLETITCLHIAAFRSDSEMMRILLQYCIEIIDEVTVLQLSCIAARNGCEEIICIFMDYGFNVTDIVYGGMNLLSFCINLCKNDRSFNIVKLLLKQENTLMQIQVPHNTLVFYAIKNRHHKIVEALLKHNASMTARIPIDHWIIKNDGYLDDKISSFNKIFPSGHRMCLYYVTCLHIAALGADPEMIKLLLYYSTDIIDDQTVLSISCIAAQNDCEEIVRIFIDCGITVTDIVYEGITLLNFCISLNDIDRGYNIVKLLLQQEKATIHIQTPGNTFVYEAIRRGHYAIAKLLLDYKADVGYVDPDGNTLLHKTIECNLDEQFIRTLMKLKPPIDAKNAQGLTAFHRYLKKDVDNQLQIIIRIFLDHGANILGILEAVSMEMNNRMKSKAIWEEIIRIITMYLIKMEINELKKIDQNLKLIYLGQVMFDMGRFTENCEREIEKMKLERIVNIDSTDNITLYDLLNGHVNFLNRFVEIKGIQKTLDQKAFNKKFPLHINIIRFRFREAKLRYPVMNSARDCFSKNVCQQLPYECIDMVLNYLNNEELKLFIRAMKLSNK